MSVAFSEEILRMSMEILVPVRPRNCESAEVRYVRAVRGSRESLLVLFVGWFVEWVILFH